MSEFCQQCSIEIFGTDFREFAGLIDAAKVAEGYGAVVLCEHCGTILVDHEGRCLEPVHPHPDPTVEEAEAKTNG